jgi:hypothetical protein
MQANGQHGVCGMQLEGILKPLCAPAIEAVSERASPR